MNTPVNGPGKWTERPSAAPGHSVHSEVMFERLFERSADAIWLLDPESGVFVDCNQAAVQLMRSGSKEAILSLRPEDLSPAFQPCGAKSSDKAREITVLTLNEGSHRFEWLARRLDGENVPLEVIATPIVAQDRILHVIVSRDISERKRSEQALRESQQLLASVADNISEAIYRSAPDHRLTFVNQAYLTLFRYNSLTELQAIPREQLYSNPTTRTRLLKMLATTGAFMNEEVEFIRKDRTRFWGLASGRVIRDSVTGEVSYHVGSITDITARKDDEAEILRLNESLERRIADRTAELSASEARLRTLLEHAPEAIVVFDGETGKFLFGNLNACHLWGVTAEGLANLTPGDVSPEFQPNGLRSVDPARENMRKALAGGAPVFEWVHRDASGRLIPTEVRLVRLPGEGKTLIRASIIDNTERKKAEQALRESEEKFRALFHASSQGVLLHDEDHYLEANAAAARILGFRSPKDLIGRHPRHTSPAFQPDGENSDLLARQHIQDCLSSGSTRFDWIAQSPQGKPIPLEVILTRVEWGGRQLIQAVINDISERKQAEAELLKALAREKELGQLKSNFVSMVSHEFRTPLGVILSSAEILDNYFDQLDTADRREQLQSIQKNTRRMANLMEEVLLLGMVEAGKLEFQPAAIDLEAFCHRLIDEVASATNHKCPISLHLRLTSNEAQADERLLRHIFSNLLNNAVKYSPEGVRVEFEIENSSREALCRVTDRGVGIPAEDLPWLFGAFQ
ncbi:MAG TPA: PAS domain S-box protein, partial [Clostridia bacterium]|nr:PAS domain S-box protein [Clostridia bacterium]